MKTTKEFVKNMNVRGRAILKALTVCRKQRLTKSQKARYVEEWQQINYFMKRTGAYEW